MPGDDGGADVEPEAPADGDVDDGDPVQAASTMRVPAAHRAIEVRISLLPKQQAYREVPCEMSDTGMKEITMNTVRSKDGTTIAFDRTGEGPAVILVGGAIQHRAIDPSTARLAELLSSTFTVVHYDRRGRGDSGDTAPYAVERELDDIDALIQDAGGSASLFGMSSGAVLSLDAAERGLAVTKLALYEPPFMVDDTRPPVPQDYRARLSAMLSEGRRGDAVELFMTEAVGMPAEAVPPMRGAPFWPGLESVAHTLPYDDAIMGDLTSGKPLPPARWAGVTIPTLVIDGGESPAWARNAVQAIVDVLPQAERRTLDGQTHQVDPEVLGPLLGEFLVG